ncbi:MAG: signal peptidase II [Planctomyces sp.]|nr:signal peptidase II [Planctomyces sp.]
MSALHRPTRLLALAVIMCGCVGCDQATKVYAVRNLKGQPPAVYLNGLLRVHYVENPGAFLGLFGGLPQEVKFGLLVVGNALVLGAVAIYLLRGRHLDAWMFLALSLIVAGGVGNLIDRWRLDGRVIDFLNVGFGDKVWMRTGIFNVADVAITLGFLMLLPRVFRSETPDRPTTPTVPAS